ncbi:MAG: VCBS repeat-containing protein [Ectothiorhodospiraceae bacterium]|nr:VCBS repeat-containing protein [Ectothiorhodospiraceae bacterium]
MDRRITMPRHRRWSSWTTALTVLLVALSGGGARAGVIAGSVPDGFAVDAVGAATYSISIEVPPGRHGFQPELGLAYSSHAGDGLVGLGWSLIGLAAIHRCPATVEHDGARRGITLMREDALCIDGDRLVLVDGTHAADGAEYRTAIDRLMRVRAHGAQGEGPQWFSVDTHDGLTLTFGASADSRIEGASDGTVRVWALTEATDPFGNRIRATYHEDASAGEYYPVRLEYVFDDAGRPLATVELDYESRPDASPQYLAGERLVQTRRLARIRTSADSTPVRDYRLSYAAHGARERSVLRSVSLCDAAGDCMVPWTFDWSTPASGRVGVATSSVPSTTWDVRARARHLGDFDGDGRVDVAFVGMHGDGSIDVLTALSLGDGQFSPLVHSVARDVGSIGEATTVVADFDGDARADLAWVETTTGAGVRIHVSLAIGAGRFAPARVDVPVSIGDYSEYEALVGEFDGDGRADVALIRAPDQAGLHVYTVRSRGDGTFGPVQFSQPRPSGTFGAFSVLTGDFDADGITDLAWVSPFHQGGLRAYLSLGDGVGGLGPAVWNAPRTAGDFSRYAPVVGDFNGDGATDLAWTRGTEGAGLRTYVALSLGNGRLASVTWSAPRTSGDFTEYTPVVGDFDGDELADIGWLAQRKRVGTRVYVSRSLGNGRMGSATYNAPVQSGDYEAFRPIVGDLDGDGLADVGWVEQPAGFGVRTLGALAAPGGARIVRFSAGDGRSHAVAYAPLSDAAAYTVERVDPGVAAPLQGALHVVATVASDDGTGGEAISQYHHVGGRVGRGGEGFLGFRSVAAYDAASGLITTTTYRLDPPFVGRPLRSEITMLDGRLISSSSSEWALAPTATGRSKLPYVSTAREVRHDPDRAGAEPLATTTVRTTVDEFGNPLSRLSVVEGGGLRHEELVQTTFDNDVSRWRLGLVRHSARTRSQLGAMPRTTLSTYAHDPLTGAVVRETIQPLGENPLTRVHAHDRFGNQIASTVSAPDIEPRTTQVAFDPSGRFPSALTDALGNVEHRVHEPGHGNVVEATDPDGRVTYRSYDGLGALVQEIHPDGTRTRITRIDCSGVGVTCPANAVSRVETTRDGAPARVVLHDRLGREIHALTQGFDGRMVAVDTIYGSRGQVARQSLPHFTDEAALWVRFEHDALGRSTRVVRPDGTSTSIAYDGPRTVTTDGSGRARSRTVDALGRPTSTTDASGQVLRFEHDVDGRVVRVIDPMGNVTSMDYDGWGNRRSMSDPDMGDWQYVHDSLGQLRSRVDAKGQTVTQVFDRLGRLVQRVESEGSTTWQYDPVGATGRLSRVQAPGGVTITHDYDGLGRPIRTRTTIAFEHFETERRYDAFGRLASIVYPRSGGHPTGLTVLHAYTGTGWLRSVSAPDIQPTPLWSAEAMDARGMVLSARLGNGIVTSREHDPATGVVRAIQSIGPGASRVQDLAYVFDAAGNLTRREDLGAGRHERFEYDLLDRLTGVVLGDASLGELSRTDLRYDALGNLIWKSDLGAITYGSGLKGPHAPDGLDGHVYRYDANGNVLEAADRGVTWSSFNKPVRLTGPGASSEFLYGPDRRRVLHVIDDHEGRREIRYVGGLLEHVAHQDGSREHRYHIRAGSQAVVYTVRGPGRGTLRYLHADHLGSVDTVTDEEGVVVERLSYDVLGARRESDWGDAKAPIVGNETPRGFTGHEHLDALGLVHMNGRVYDPRLGRFLSPDPFVQFPENLQGLNRYAYALNNPLAYTDPSGYSLSGLFRSVVRPVSRLVRGVSRLARGIVRGLGVRTIAAIAIASINPASWAAAFQLGGSAVLGAATQGFAAGLVASGGDVREALLGGIAAGVLAGPVHALPAGAGKIFAHGAVGAVRTAASGGRWSSGFLAGAFSNLAGSLGAYEAFGRGTTYASRLGNAFAAGAVGGVASTLAGGSFMQGAAVGSLGRMFNELKFVAKGVFLDTRTGEIVRFRTDGYQSPNGYLAEQAGAASIQGYERWDIDRTDVSLAFKMTSDYLGAAAAITGLMGQPEIAIPTAGVSMAFMMGHIFLPPSGDVFHNFCPSVESTTTASALLPVSVPVFVLVQKADIPYGFFLGPFLIIVGVALTARGGLRKSGEASAK